MKLPEIIKATETCLRVNRPVWIWGAPGIGKSEAVAQIAASRGAIVCDIRLSTFDPVDLRGLPMVIDGQTVWMRPGVWPTDASRETILFFDEMDRAAPAVANAALQIVLDRRIGEHLLPSTVRIVAAGNGSTDARTTSKIGSAQANRFTHLYVEPDAESAARHWLAIGLDPALSAFIRFRGAPDASTGKPGLLMTTAQAGEHAFASPRAWAACNDFMGESDRDRHALIAGTVGSAPAAEFEAFLRMWRDLPSLDSILRDPAGAPVSNELNVNFAVATGLARKVDRHTMGAAVTYAGRMRKEFAVMMITDAARRDASLCETPAYIAWATANQDVSL